MMPFRKEFDDDVKDLMGIMDLIESQGRIPPKYEGSIPELAQNALVDIERLPGYFSQVRLQLFRHVKPGEEERFQRIANEMEYDIIQFYESTKRIIPMAQRVAVLKHASQDPNYIKYLNDLDRENTERVGAFEAYQSALRDEQRYKINIKAASSSIRQLYEELRKTLQPPSEAHQSNPKHSDQRRHVEFSIVFALFAIFLAMLGFSRAFYNVRTVGEFNVLPILEVNYLQIVLAVIILFTLIFTFRKLK